MVYRPLIGISGSIDHEETTHSLPITYMRAVENSGAIAVMLSYNMDDEALEGCLDRLDGVLLSGGNDVDPNAYGHFPIYELGEVNPVRDEFEFRLVKAAFARKMPLLGICRGIQSLNVAMGGTLWQDLPSQFRTAEGGKPIRHSQASLSKYLSHEVVLEENTVLGSVMRDKRFMTNSFHHQAVLDVAPGFRVTAHTLDGVNEAIEHETLPFFMGVQWHPERNIHNEPNAKALFDGFVRACAQYGQKER